MRTKLTGMFAAVALALAAAVVPAPTFYRDVFPVLQKHCQSCHRPGEIGPMPLLTYKGTRPWAKAIREAVLLRKMPPWFADPHYGKFANDPSLSPDEIRTIRDWVDAGAPAGQPADAPAPVKWPEGWSGIRPDIVFSMPKPFPIPANAVIDYQYVIIPTGFAADRWVQAIEIRPSDRSVVHHAVLYVREPGSKWLRNVPTGVMYAPPASDPTAVRSARETKEDILAVYTPGAAATICPPSMAKKIVAGSDLVLQLHYTARNQAAEDRTRIGLEFLNGSPERRILTLQMGQDHLAIPPGESDYRVSVSGTMPRDALLLSLFPHMHLRGSQFEFQLAAPGGHLETLLDVKPFDFYWQLSYQLKTPRLLRKGDRLLWTAHYDNSPNNPRNPDPTVEVEWGEQSWQEMMIGFFDVAVEPDVDKQSFFAARASDRGTAPPPGPPRRQ